MSESTGHEAAKPENPLVSIVFNVVIPMLILAKGDALPVSPAMVVVVAFVFPLGYFLWDFAQRKKVSFIALLGGFNVLLSGGFGLMELDGFWFAVKEAAFPLLIGVVVLGSLWTKRPLVHMMLYNKNVIEVDKVAKVLEERGNTQAFDRLLRQATYLLTASFLVSAVLNFGLARYLLKSPPGTSEFNQELAKMTGLSYPVIVLPCMIIMIAALWLLIRGIKKLTGLKLEDIFKQPPPKAPKNP